MSHRLVLNPSSINRHNKYSSKLVTSLNDFDHTSHWYNNDEFMRITTYNGIIWECYIPLLLINRNNSGGSYILINLLDFIVTVDYYDGGRNNTNLIGKIYQNDDGHFIAKLNYDIETISIFNKMIHEHLPSTEIVQYDKYPIDSEFCSVDVKSIERFYIKYKIFSITNVNKVVDLYR
jgi:hypothetical protein